MKLKELLEIMNPCQEVEITKGNFCETCLVIEVLEEFYEDEVIYVGTYDEDIIKITLRKDKKCQHDCYKKILYDILWLVEGISYEYCKSTDNTDLMNFIEEEVYKINCKIKEINTDETL